VSNFLRKLPPPHFSDRSFLNYKILSEMFFKCVIHRVFRQSGFPDWSFETFWRSRTFFNFWLSQY